MAGRVEMFSYSRRILQQDISDATCDGFEPWGLWIGTLALNQHTTRPPTLKCLKWNTNADCPYWACSGVLRSALGRGPHVEDCSTLPFVFAAKRKDNRLLFFLLSSGCRYAASSLHRRCTGGLISAGITLSQYYNCQSPLVCSVISSLAFVMSRNS